MYFSLTPKVFPCQVGGRGLGTKLCVLHVPECVVGFVSQPAVFMFECVQSCHVNQFAATSLHSQGDDSDVELVSSR